MLNPDVILERHSQLYFSDGDVVLSAKVTSTSATASGSPPRYQLYRVHKPVLSHNSPVLANLFADAAPADVYDGAPLVEMIGDSAEALASLLAFIYDPSQVDFRRWDPNAALSVSPMVRIANKYLVDRLRAHIVSKIKQDWPLALEEWDRREAEIEAMRSVELTSGDRAPSSKSPAHSVPEPASAIRFAREFGCTEILPAAFYQLSVTDVNRDWDKPDSYNAHHDLRARWSLIENSDLLCVLRGRQKIAQHLIAFGANNNTYTEILMPPCIPWWEDASITEEVRPRLEREGRPSLDPKEYPCYTFLDVLYSRVFRRMWPGVQDPLKAMKDCILEYETMVDASAGPATRRLCSGCEENLRAWIPWARRYVWGELPEMFQTLVT